jgi:hypothetical protein
MFLQIVYLGYGRSINCESVLFKICGLVLFFIEFKLKFFNTDNSNFGKGVVELEII